MDPEQSLAACLCSSTDPGCRNGPGWGAWCSRTCLEQGKRWSSERRKLILSCSGPISLRLGSHEKGKGLQELAEPGVGKIYALVLSVLEPPRTISGKGFGGCECGRKEVISQDHFQTSPSLTPFPGPKDLRVSAAPEVMAGP